MELLDTIKTLIKPILENNDVYLDDIEYLQENGEWYLRIFVEKNEGLYIIYNKSFQYIGLIYAQLKNSKRRFLQNVSK